ncbi:MAG: hypothetical protein ACI8PZ_000918 [Myxococcota bacterium]|jgi:hypothetical protein
MRTITLSLLIACGAPEPAATPSAATPAAEAPTPAEAPSTAEAAPAAGAATAARDDAAWTYFGEPFQVATALPAKSVFPDPSAHAKGPVRVNGELTQVCQKAGCWAVVRDGEGHTMRITMKEHSFGIAKDSMGKACDVEGTLVSKAVDPATLAHFESEGATDHPEAGKKVAWELVASSVAIAR